LACIRTWQEIMCTYSFVSHFRPARF
jgi:hypothetical protein